MPAPLPIFPAERTYLDDTASVKEGVTLRRALQIVEEALLSVLAFSSFAFHLQRRSIMLRVRHGTTTGEALLSSSLSSI